MNTSEHFDFSSDKSVDSERRAFHNGDGSHRRWETKREQRERVQKQRKANYYDAMGKKHRTFRNYCELFGFDN